MKVGCIGELVVDFISMTRAPSIKEAATFQKCPGGSPANVAAGLHTQGIEAILISRIGSDRFGMFLSDTLVTAGLLTNCIAIDPEHPTRCVFMAHDHLGRRSVEIANRQSADQHISMDQITATRIGKLDLLHIGGTTLLGEVTSATTLALVERVKSERGIVSFDPNINLNRISDAAMARLKHLIPFVDILKVNEDEWTVVKHLMPPEIHQRPKIVITTLGEKGALIKSQNHDFKIEAEQIQVVDVTGAGDAFFAGFLGYLINNADDPLSASLKVLLKSGKKASECASRVIQHVGGALSNL